MASIQKTKVFLYKKARLQSGKRSGFNLESAFHEASVNILKQARSRRYKHGPDKDDVHVLSEVIHHGGFPFGLVIDYTIGQQKSLADIESEGATIPLRTSKAGRKGEEWVDTIGYIGVKRNHVILSQSMSLRSMQFETYLNWLLRKAEQIGDEEMIFLEDHPPPKDPGILKSDNIRSLELSAPLVSDEEYSSASVTGLGGRDVTNVSDIVVRPKSGGFESLRAMLGEILGKDISLDSMREATLIDIALTLKFSKTSRGRESGLMANIAHKLRHADNEIDYEIQLKKGGTITKDQMKVQNPFRIPIVEDQLSAAHIRRAMLDWLESLLKEGRVLD